MLNLYRTVKRPNGFWVGLDGCDPAKIPRIQNCLSLAPDQPKLVPTLKVQVESLFGTIYLSRGLRTRLST